MQKKGLFSSILLIFYRSKENKGKEKLAGKDIHCSSDKMTILKRMLAPSEVKTPFSILPGYIVLEVAAIQYVVMATQPAAATKFQHWQLK